jgi:hypothetical protein
MIVVSAPFFKARSNSEASITRALYFVAGTITDEAYIDTYPVSLYSVDSHAKLTLVRSIYNSSQGLQDVSDDLHGRLYLVGDSAVTIIHKDKPQLEDIVPVDTFNDAICWGAALVKGDSLALFCPPDKVMRILGDKQRESARVSDGSWEMFHGLQYDGVIGGPRREQIPVARVVTGHVVLPDFKHSVPKVVLSDLPPFLDAKSYEGDLVWVMAASEHLFAFSLEPPEIARLQIITEADPGHATPIRIYVYDKDKDKWRTIEAPTTVTGYTAPGPVRMFYPWLAITVAQWNPGPDQSPGQENERNWSNQQFPNVLGGYTSRNHDLFLPGQLVLRHLLADDRSITLQTNQEDSEVLDISPSGELLYRINDAIYSAQISEDRITAPKLLVKDADVPEIHWAFWGPPIGKNPQYLGASRRSD